MTLGQRIKQLRLDKELNQPELAQAIGIEQSYLSKLENDKAFPSDEMFEKLLQSFSITIEEFLVGFDQATTTNQLMKLSAVNKMQRHINKKSAKYLFSWIIAAGLMAAIGVTLFAAGEKRWFFKPVYKYGYQSMGVVESKEPLLMFQGNSERLSNDILARVNPKSIKLLEKNGQFFIRQVEGGTRYYEYQRQHRSKDPQANNWMKALGIFLALIGIVGLIIEPKIRRIKLLAN